MSKIMLITSLFFIISCSEQTQNNAFKTKVYEKNKMNIKIKDNPDTFHINDKYWINIDLKGVSPSDILVTCNNGRIFKSDVEGYNFMFIPSRNDSLKIRIYNQVNIQKLSGEVYLWVMP